MPDAVKRPAEVGGRQEWAVMFDGEVQSAVPLPRSGPRREGDIGLMIANCDRLMNRLGWAPKHDDLDYIIATALAWEGNLMEQRKSA